MITQNVKSLLLRMNTICSNVLHDAAGLCVTRTNYEVSVEHFLLKILENNESDLQLILRRFEIDPGRLQKGIELGLEDFKTGNAGKPVFSPVFLELIQDAWLISSIDLGNRKIRSGAIFIAFLGKLNFYGSGYYSDILKNINRETLMNEFGAITASSEENTVSGAEMDTPASGAGGVAEGGFLQKYCEDFTKKAKDGKIDPVFGRDNEIRQMVDILARRRKNNPICVGEPGVGKTAVIEGLALRIVEGDVPEVLQGVKLVSLDMGLLEAGAGMKGEFESRLKGVINEIKSSEQPIILFIDEAHTLIGAGGTAGGADAANLLKPALARGELRTVAATTWSEYKKYFEKDPALARRFQPVKLDEPSVDDTVLILRGLKASYEKAHNVIVRDDAILCAADMSDKYITGRFLPDKAIDLIDTSCARIKVNLTSKPASLEDKERGIQAIDRAVNAIERDQINGIEIDLEELDLLKKKKEDFGVKAEEIRLLWEKEKEKVAEIINIRAELTKNDTENKEELILELRKKDKELLEIQGDEPLVFADVSPDVVAQVVSDWTGIPLGKVLRDEADTILNLADKLKERIKGQDEGLEVLAEVIKASKSGIKSPEQPMGVFLFAGPSGVGKTETGLTLADLIFGGERSVVTINMSEFQEAHTVSRLVGSPPGYVGYGEGGLLTEAVRQKPYSVVLLDEVEKAHLDVLNLFYQVFDKGMLTDGEGKEINFRNTIIILTSNLASDVIQEMTASEDKLPIEIITNAVRPILSKHFKPALLARMDVIPFYSLAGDALKGIVRIKLNKLKKRLHSNNKLELEYTDEVVDQITARCTEVETGARNIDYILNGNVLPQLSQMILEKMGTGDMPDKVNMDVDKEGQFTMEFE